MPKVLYECEFCGKKFASKASCQEHEKKCEKNKENTRLIEKKKSTLNFKRVLTEMN